ncbi:MAG: hypothetical protein ACE5EL_05455, partial [Anaerolineae bacterium]
MPAGQLITVVAPWFLGDPRAGDYRGAQNANEMALYIGILPLILVLAGAYARRDSKARWAALLAVTVAMMALGSPAAWVLARIPGANMFGLMRWLGVWPLAAALMVGLGLSAPELGGATRRRFVHAAAAAAASLVAILVAAALVVEGAAGGVVAPLGLLGLSIAALVYWVHHHESRAAQAAVLTVIAADLLLFGHGYTPSAATADAFPLVPPLDWLTAQRRASEFRIAAYQGDRLVLVPAVAPSVGLDDVGGYSSSARRSYRDFVGRLTVPSGNGLVDFNANMVTFGDAKLVLLQMLNVGYVLSADVLRPEEQSIVPLDACTQVRRLVRDERVSRP